MEPQATTGSFKLPFAWAHIFLAFAVGLMLSFLVFIDPLVFSHLDFYYGTINISTVIPFEFAILFLVCLLLLSCLSYFFSRNFTNNLLLFLLVLTPFVTVISENIIEIGFIVLVIAFLVVFARSCLEGRTEFRASPTFLFIIGLAVFWLNSLMAPCLGVGEKIKGLLTVALHVCSRLGFFSFIVLFVNDFNQVRRFLDYMFIFGLISGVIGLFQLAYFFITGSEITFSTGVFVWLETPFGLLPRSTALMISPNELGVVTAISTVILLGYLLWEKDLGVKRKCMYWLCIIILLVSQGPPLSRSALMALAVVVCLISFLYKPSKGIHVLLLYLLIAIAATLVGLTSYMVENFLELNTSSADFRIYTSQIAFRAIRHFPLTGIGLGNFSDYNNVFNLIVHNTFLQPAADFGLLGALIFWCFLFFIVIRIGLLAIPAPTPPHGCTYRILFLVCLIYLVAAPFQPFMFLKHLWLVLAVTEASILLNRETEKDYLND
ncbi:MAG: O-antigen ligase domain-containing protein [Candidatus Abyssobacteria bacterium SURF_5]|uniref:O-antigen ligase domain-containing protein n=1 Tax=Abyssobacteria bacterium (strain SURF_5) TaxID=2093360 RepID=A0A3A4PBY2_ABYX5|nr:MAG: O-antigen ligase domain-containing protein [Candidatus Abyssubacteria bacterium SURF_5]